MNFDELFWENKYQQQEIGWDIGYISTPLKEYFNQLNDKNIQILIPGGGNSYEAEYLHQHGFTNIYVVDIAKTALTNIKKRVSSFPENNLLLSDFFTLHKTHPELQFDLIVEQTFFCAIPPSQRIAYAKQVHKLLKPKGKLIGVLFNDALNTNKPPFGGSKKEYITYFENIFEILTMEKCYNSITERKNRELFIQLLKN